MRKLLFLEWKSFGNEFILEEFKQAGLQPVLFPFPREEEDTRRGEELAAKLVQAVLGDSYEFVFSFNYFPVAAIACKACKVKYVSWVYDSPFIQLYSQTITYPTNYIFVFDRGTCQDLLSKGADTVYYLPMAAQPSYYDKMIPSRQERESYGADVSFVGALYSETKNHIFRHLEKLDEYTRGYLDALMQAQKGIYGYHFLEGALLPEIVRNMQKVCPITAQGDGMESVEWTYANYFLARKITAMERTDVMQLLSKEFEVKLYTGEETPQFPKVLNKGKVDYYTQAPYVFRCSKINLNISLRSILTGIPQRAFDIMGCCGFLLSNFQMDYLEHFEPGGDFVYYESMEDLADKVRYYLKHDAERKQIAESGYEKVKAHHTYGHRISYILQEIL